MKTFAPLAVALLLAGPGLAETWRCDFPYDEVNGGGRVTVGDERLVFVSDWPHREPQTVKCIRTGRTSECMSARLLTNKRGGASVFSMLYSITWQEGGGPPTRITTRQVSAIFEDAANDFALDEAFPAIGYSFPLTDCEAD